MTVESTVNKSGPYAGAGSPGPFTVGFRFLDQAHLRVIKTSTAGVNSDLVLTTDYSVAGVGNPTGSVTLVVALAVGEKLTIVRNVPFTQEANYVQNDAFPAESHEAALDKLTMEVQQLDERVGSALTLPPNVTGASTELPSPLPNHLIGWDQDANALQNVDPATLATIVAFGTAVADLFSGDGVQTDFALTYNPGSQANLHVSIGAADQRPGIDFTWSGGTTLHFITPPPVGTDNILVQYMQGLPQGSSDSASAAFIQAGLGAVPRTAQEKMRDRFSVKDFGAIGNGLTDDSAAINAAEAAASAAGRSVYFPAGTYLCASSLYRLGDTDWVGEGMHSSIIKHSGGAATHHLVTVPDVDVSYNHIGFYNLGFDSNRSGSTDPAAARVTIYMTRNGDGGDSSPAEDIRVIGCRIFNFSYGGSGMNLSGYTGLKVMNNDIRDGGGGLIHCIYIRRCGDVVVTGNTCVGQDGNTSIKVQLSPRSTISHNVVGGGNHAINAQDSDQTTIIGNLAYDCTDSAIAVTIETLPAATNATITGNVIQDCVRGVELNNTNSVVVSGNVFREFAEKGVYIRSCQDFTIVGNVFRTADTSFANCHFVEFNAGPSASRGVATGNRMISSRGSGNTSAFFTDEASVANFNISGNSTSNSGWTNKFNGIRPLTKFDPTAAAPSSPSDGDTYFDSTLNKLRTWAGGAWNNLF